MKIDASQSIYHETSRASIEFNRQELRRCRYLLRRLRFLEAQVKQSDDADPATMHAEWEIQALAWALTDLGFLSPERKQLADRTS